LILPKVSASFLPGWLNEVPTTLAEALKMLGPSAYRPDFHKFGLAVLEQHF
jgi:hypothetical protein